MDLLVSYPWTLYFKARPEILAALSRFGDPEAIVEKTQVPGMALVHTRLDNREVVKRCQELFASERAFRFAIKWVPVDWWCETNLDAMKALMDQTVTPRIQAQESFQMQVAKRRWHSYHTSEIIKYLAAGIDRKVNLKNPTRIIHVDVLGERTAISLLRPGEIFSVNASRP